MSEPKVHCTQCGTEILSATARRTGGICMPCKNGGGAPEWARRQLWFKHGADPLANIPWHRSPWGREIITICDRLVSGELGCVEGSRALARLSETVLNAAHGDKWIHEDWAIFFKVLQYGARDFIPANYSEQVRAAALKLLKEANEATA
jgi:hypothetical protein